MPQEITDGPPRKRLDAPTIIQRVLKLYKYAGGCHQQCHSGDGRRPESNSALVSPFYYCLSVRFLFLPGFKHAK